MKWSSYLVLGFVEDFMGGAQSAEYILTGISKVDALLYGLDFTISHHTKTRTCSQQSQYKRKSQKLHINNNKLRPMCQDAHFRHRGARYLQ